MSRSGYSDDCEGWGLIRYRGQVASAVRGKRGQKLLRDLLTALEAMPVKRLIAHELKTTDGEVCALGALGVARGLAVELLDPEEPDHVAAWFNIAVPLAREIVYENDEHGPAKGPDGIWGPETPEHRYERMKNWVKSQILPSAETTVRRETQTAP